MVILCCMNLFQVMGGNGSLPSLSELLTKSVAELSEEVITLKLELETEKRWFELKII